MTLIRTALAACAACFTGCASSTAPDPGLEALALASVSPTTIIPGTKLVVRGASFVDARWGEAALRLTGDGLDLRLPARFVDFNTLSVAVDAQVIAQAIAAAGGTAEVRSIARVEVIAASDGETYTTPPLAIALSFRERLEPQLASLEAAGVIFVNEQIAIEGSGFLLGGDEGVTVARLAGCFTPEAGGACRAIAPIELPLAAAEPESRTRAAFPFSPRIAGIKPGAFTGTVTIENRQPSLAPSTAAARDVAYDLVTPQIFSLSPPAASLGQFVLVRGGGFVGGEAGAVTEIEVSGTFRRNGGAPVPVLLTLIPDFVDGALVRYIINTDDELGQALDLRADTGSFTGTATPIASYGPDRVRGVATPASFGIAPVKQVVHLQFQPSYVEGLRDFGLRAAQNRIRDRILEVCERSFAGVNIEFRTEPPTDFALYAQVELLGEDPNGAGLFGYDNSPGKDSGNLRLYDRLGGVNAATQADGFPGYGGVFLRSIMGFSKHPGAFAQEVPGADPLFDAIFDPLRPDRGGEAIRAADLSGGAAVLPSGASCPERGRKGQIACAIYVLGSLVGGTLAHELGHSLGLANPNAEGFHNPGDQPNRLMDGGADRPFAERAELSGQGPAVFCDDEYEYLRMILPSTAPAPAVSRPGCY